MVLDFGMFESRNALITSEQDFISMSGYGFVASNDRQPYYVGGRFKFNSDGVSLSISAYGSLNLPDNVTVTRVVVYGTNTGASDLKFTFTRTLLSTSAGHDELGLSAINTVHNVSIDINTKLYAYHIFVKDNNDAEENVYINGVYVEFERGKK